MRLERTILLVEDEALVRWFASEVLDEAGYHVVPAENALEALIILADMAALDLLVTDIVMPGGRDGFALAQSAKAVRPELKILYISGYSWAAAQAHAGQLHGELLRKPFRRDDLLDAVRRSLTGGAPLAG
jgi:DNA-binding NtrC family response regulator